MATKKPAANEPIEPASTEAAVASEAETVDAAVVESSAPAADAAVVEVEAVAVETDASEAAPAVEPVVDAVPAEPAQQVIVIDAPVPPKKRGNRGLSVLLAVLATLIFGALLAGVAIVLRLYFGETAAPAVTEAALYFPAIFFLIGLVLVSIILNRAGWWSHIIGSVVVAAIVWFGSAALSLVAAGVTTMTQSQANEVYFEALFSPIAIIAALLAREVAIWTGAILARRGRSLKVRNAEAHAAYEQERSELMPTTK